MRHTLKTNMNPLLKNLFDMDYDISANLKQLAKVNIKEDEKGYDLSFSIAGYRKGRLKRKIENDNLTVSANINTEDKKENKNFTRREFQLSSFSRSFYLPEQVEEENIEANYENGILNLHLPKTAKEESSKVINIK